jgi:glycine cleavage system regulatory protein
MKNWVGFLKLHLKHPLKDKLALLRGERVFVMDIEGGKRVISKVEKEFVLVTKARNLQLHMKGDILCNHIAYNICNTIVHES